MVRLSLAEYEASQAPAAASDPHQKGSGSDRASESFLTRYGEREKSIGLRKEHLETVINVSTQSEHYSPNRRQFLNRDGNDGSDEK
ncbi:hypothetical protein HO173_011286 [Letharia columbiana]|uniref:Uncharacterized protein n=1 Tax=Letharia columbiana TaxID=112416 RepID=A0A8H6KZB4_9LECA|nr:uncharacterized protein HO173_011286 [Letharia columbiana]KAF6229770.1 hypothetical protein HO173_011286 [Letharia columbiana]